MKISYKGCLYESYYTSPTGTLNEKHQRDLKELTDSVYNQILSLDKSTLSDQLIPLQLSDPSLPKLFLQKDSKNEKDGAITINPNTDYYILNINENLLVPNLSPEYKELLYSTISHEINHYFQLVYGTINEKDHPKDNSEHEYYNSPHEINSILNAYYQRLLHNDRLKKYLKSLSYDDFIKDSFSAMGLYEEDVNKHFEEHARQTFYETLRFIYAKLKRNEI